jgi:tyrosine-protein phosphatase SIW14
MQTKQRVQKAVGSGNSSGGSMHTRRFLLRRGVIFSLAASLTLCSAWASPQNEDLPNFQKVDDDVYRGAQPTNSGFKDLAKRGIKTVVDLRDIGEHSQADEQKAVTDLGMRYVSVPMQGMATPKGQQIAAVLALLNDVTSGPVFVHCKRGADRTGTVIALYRIIHDGWDSKRALSEAKSYGMSMFQRAMQHYVTEYKTAGTVASADATAASVDTRQPAH